MPQINEGWFEYWFIAWVSLMVEYTVFLIHSVSDWGLHPKIWTKKLSKNWLILWGEKNHQREAAAGTAVALFSTFHVRINQCVHSWAALSWWMHRGPCILHPYLCLSHWDIGREPSSSPLTRQRQFETSDLVFKKLIFGCLVNWFTRYKIFRNYIRPSYVTCN